MPPGPAAGLRSAAARAVPGPAFAALMRAVYPRLEPELACLDTWAPRGGGPQASHGPQAGCRAWHAAYPFTTAMTSSAYLRSLPSLPVSGSVSGPVW